MVKKLGYIVLAVVSASVIMYGIMWILVNNYNN
jgi:hypothetical protein